MERVRLHSAKWKTILWLCILIVLFGGIYFYTHRSSQSGKKLSGRPGVTVETMERKDMMKRVVLSGETVPKASVDISPKYAGRIASINVDLGDHVEAGDVLLTQDTKDISLSLAANRAGSEQAAADAVESRSSYDAGTMKAQSDYDNALTTYERYETLFGEGAVSRQERDDKYRAMMEAKAALESLTGQDVGGIPAVIASKEAAASKAQYTADALAAQKEDMTILSPVSGTIGYRNAEAGEWASAGQKLLTVVDNSSLYMDCAVAEQDIGALREGMAVSVSIDSLGKEIEGTISYISPALDAASHSYKVRILLSGGADGLRGGLFGRSEVTALERKDAIYLPKEGVLDNNGKKYAFLVDENHKVKKVEVTTGLYNDEDVEIVKGIAPGDHVAVTNISKLKDGMTVDIEGGSV
ncbi:efflux RND transporter periplasmic adaptor subunit [uncultured Dialister sp.]|uniref:efflux RND transporter periplasmic adaptor subunit n=1 Tax=uncultured Dialister sp. TaxID=278064 RepID=UPI002626894E|nr:efflux RND transporter periplasmic adaptor subunit [uncultured Dialister sp.]